jgi:hypothetical protein
MPPVFGTDVVWSSDILGWPDDLPMAFP